jgi:hypothetical protein
MLETEHIRSEGLVDQSKLLVTFVPDHVMRLVAVIDTLVCKEEIMSLGDGL